MNRVGKKLREMRAQKGYSQEYVAYELGMSQGNYCKLESGSYPPSAEMLEKLAKVFDLLPEELKRLVSSESDSTQQIQWDDPKYIVGQLLASKEQIIALQAKQIQMLESSLKQNSIHDKGMTQNGDRS